jgi:hypothetical protein
MYFEIENSGLDINTLDEVTLGACLLSTKQYFYNNVVFAMTMPI